MCHGGVESSHGGMSIENSSRSGTTSFKVHEHSKLEQEIIDFDCSNEIASGNDSVLNYASVGASVPSVGVRVDSVSSVDILDN